jgi:hypothetical protein
VVAHLGGFAKAQPRARVQLIRRPERGESRAEPAGAGPSQSTGLTFYLARGTQGQLALWRTQLSRVEDCLAMDLAGWAQGAEPQGFQRVDEPLYLVCVHGRRDRCCAQRGMPVYSAFAAQLGDAVWQTSHLGGHRFAATMVVLPAGISYGRLGADEASALIAAHARGRLHALDKLRGRCVYSPEAQAADVALREQLKEHGLDAVRWLGSESREDGVYVRLWHEPSAAEHTLRITHRSVPPFPQSCGASHRPGDALIALSVR